MDIAALSTTLSQSAIMNEVGTAVMAKVMETNNTESVAMIRMMEQSVTPNLGGNIDVSI
ncbi:MAG: YjfB family protein [Clostridiales bacterium]|nr:YjfB family protein [Clostridiales bacterium]